MTQLADAARDVLPLLYDHNVGWHHKTCRGCGALALWTARCMSTDCPVARLEREAAK